MGYGRATSNQELDPGVVQTLAKLLGVELTAEELPALTTSFVNQLAAIKSLERFNLEDMVPVLKMDARWDE